MSLLSGHPAYEELSAFLARQHREHNRFRAALEKLAAIGEGREPEDEYDRGQRSVARLAATLLAEAQE